jgi:hypothetical protein
MVGEATPSHTNSGFGKIQWSFEHATLDLLSQTQDCGNLKQHQKTTQRINGKMKDYVVKLKSART